MPNLDRDYYLDKAGLAQFVNELETNIVAEEFSSSATYNLGDYCIYGNLLYICTTPITTAGSWTGSTNWLQVLLADEVAEKTEIQTITLAQWEALTPDQKASGDYVISDATLSPLSASLIPYDNTTSGLTADDVQEAIDELAQGSASSMAQLTDVKLTSPQNGQELVYDNTLTSPYKWENRTTRVELTQAQYDALVTAGTVLPDVDYYITDAPSMNGTSADLSYDGTTKSVYIKIGEMDTTISGKVNSSDIPSWIKQEAGTSISLYVPFTFCYYYADQWTAHVQFPFITKNTNYSITLNDVIAENVGSIVSKCSVVEKQYCFFDIRTTRTMSSLPDIYSTCIGRCRFTITFA